MKIKVERDKYWPYYYFYDSSYSDEIELTEEEYKFIKIGLEWFEDAQAILREKVNDL